MASYPAFVQLIRLLGRQEALQALALDDEPDPDTLDDAQLARLQALVDQQLENVVAELVSEAAASDDVSGRAGARAWIADRVAGFAGLLAPGQAERLRDAAAALTADWG